MKSMSAKNQYNLLYFLFCLVGCCAAGFVAVFLQYKGVSNTQIGVVTGSACVASIFIAPWLSSLIMKIERMTVNDLLVYILLKHHVHTEIYSLNHFLHILYNSHNCHSHILYYNFVIQKHNKYRKNQFFEF